MDHVIRMIISIGMSHKQDICYHMQFISLVKDMDTECADVEYHSIVH
jgi:hypothetical protein